MNINRIHDFKASSEEEFKGIQERLLEKIELINRIEKEDIKSCAGVDLAYWNQGEDQYGVCSIVVIDYKTKEVLEKVHSWGKITTEYIPGFLAFRELPLVVEAAEKLSIDPDIFMFDGNGYLHWKHMGIATHASLFLDKPTIGVAKSYLKVNGVDFIMPEDCKGASTDIMIDGERYGRVLRTRVGVKPIFISCGNYIDIETTTDIVKDFVNVKESRLPSPVRLADLETHKLRDMFNQNDNQA